MFVNYFHDIVLLISSKTTAPQHVIFSGKLSTIIIFKLCKFSVNPWTLCFLSYKKVHKPFKDTSLTTGIRTHTMVTKPPELVFDVLGCSPPACGTTCLSPLDHNLTFLYSNPISKLTSSVKPAIIFFHGHTLQRSE